MNDILENSSEAPKDAAPVSYGNSERQEIARLIPEQAKVLLDVGCHTGGFGAGLKRQRQLEVWGLEPNELAARQAARVLDQVLTERFDANTAAPKGHFDVVFFNDVLEHFLDPWEALHIARERLRPGGCVIASIPNVLHQSNLRHMLFERDFRYEPVGIRDQTHLRFFTRKSMIRLFSDCGFQVETLQGINEDWWHSDWKTRLAYRFFRRALEETKYIQFAIVAKPR